MKYKEIFKIIMVKYREIFIIFRDRVKKEHYDEVQGDFFTIFRDLVKGGTI